MNQDKRFFISIEGRDIPMEMKGLIKNRRGENEWRTKE